MAEPKTTSLTKKIIIGMAVGAVLGVLINLFVGDTGIIRDYVIDGLLYVVGSIFIASLKMLVVPLVFVSLVGGVTSLGNLAALGRMSVKAITLYLLTTAIAITIALTLAISFATGRGPGCRRSRGGVQGQGGAAAR